MDPETLQVGDCLLYRPHDFFGWLISVKSWTRIAHVEVYAGERMSWASRDGIGVNLYALRLKQLAYVLRPTEPFDALKARAYFNTVRGQKYDWKGLLCFTLAVKQGAKDRMFCSEFALRLDRAAGFNPVSQYVDADHMAPAEFRQSAAFTQIWADNQKDY